MEKLSVKITTFDKYIIWTGLDGYEARSMEMLTEIPPTLLKKRRRAGNSKYCLKVVSGAQTNAINIGPVIAPAERR